jgi:hypothetical protein
MVANVAGIEVDFVDFPPLEKRFPRQTTIQESLKEGTWDLANLEMGGNSEPDLSTS